jgi:osmotically inducible lipoprotein OsmB
MHGTEPRRFDSNPSHRRDSSFWRLEMDKIKQIGAAALIAALLGGLSACDQMTTRQRDTAVGAGVGGVAGAALGGSTLSTVGGAAAGGLIGNQVGK